MDSDAEAEIGDAAARLSLIVDEAYRRNASRLLHEDVIALAALVDAAGVRDLGDGRLAVRPHALIPAPTRRFIRARKDPARGARERIWSVVSSRHRPASVVIPHERLAFGGSGWRSGSFVTSIAPSGRGSVL